MRRKTNLGSEHKLLATAVMLTITGLSLGQQSAPSHKVLTPEQRQFQAATAQWTNHRNALRAQAQAALNDEAAREKAGDCPGAGSTSAAEKCLTAAMEKTQSNYTTFANSIRAMLGLAYPTMPGQQTVPGPTGTPLTPSERVAEFDQLEARSKLYRQAAVGAAYDQYKGGTLAPVFAAEAEQRLLRLHLQELAFIYENELADR